MGGRCFVIYPELLEVGELLPPDSALDGENRDRAGWRARLDAMQMRLHPAEAASASSRLRFPLSSIAFDVLAWKGEQVNKLPLGKRRARSSE